MTRPRHEQLLEQLQQRLVPLVGQLKSVPLTPQLRDLQAHIAATVRDASDYIRGAQRGKALNRMHVEFQLERALEDCSAIERILTRSKAAERSS